jgi:hypothetical protein
LYLFLLLTMCMLMAPTTIAAQEPWPSARTGGHVLAYDAARDVIVLVGGDSNLQDQTQDSVWMWSGKWRVSSAVGPSWRTLPQIAFDSRRGRILLQGGRSKTGQRQYGQAEADTWEWNGLRWRQLPVNSPGPLDHHAMAYDSANDVLLIQGGADGGRILPGVTWGFDGSAWKQVADAASGPGERVHHAMAYDSRRRRVVMYGGTDTQRDPARAAETWEWDGAKWTRVGINGPLGARARHRMAYDAARGLTLLFGSNNDSRTWAWDGSQWRVVAETGPSPREMHAMTYDSKRGRVVLYGGNPGSAELWEWDGTRWTQHSQAQR